MPPAAVEARGGARGRLLVLLAAIVVAGLMARLGLWQLDRAGTKRALQTAQDTALARAPLTIASPAALHDLQAAGDWEHRPAVLLGRWLPAAQFWLGNRNLGQGAGFVLVTPLALRDGGLIWVQRGWVLRRGAQFEAPPWPLTPEGEVQVLGRLAPQASRAYALGEAGQGPVRQNLDLSLVIPNAPVALPVVLWQTGAACKPLVCDWPAVDLGVDKHLGYALQWFALSALTVSLYVWFQIIRPRRRPH